MSGMKISVDDVNDIGENKWIVKSQTNDESYEVIFLSPDCYNAICFNGCTNEGCRGLCVHMYHCSCKDKNRLCKHIHRVHSIRVEEFEPTRFLAKVPEDEYDEDPIFHDAEVVDEDVQTQASSLQLDRAIKYWERIGDLLQNSERVRTFGINAICHALEEVTSKCETYATENIIEGFFSYSQKFLQIQKSNFNQDVIRN